MKLLFFFAFLAISCAEDNNVNQQLIEDLEAAETVEIMKEGADLKPEATAYNYVQPSQRPSQWNQQYQNNWNNNQNWNNPQNTWTQPQNTWNPPQEVKPVQPAPSYPSISPPQNDYVQNPPHYHPPTTTTPVPVIKNEQYYGDNGSYKYEYQIADGTHVGEEGYFTDPKGTDESIVKKGWYSFTAADGKVYTVTYWADKTGFHAYGDHLPTPPPVPAAIQAAMDKEQAQKKPVYADTYPTSKPTYNPTTVPPYNPGNQNNYYPDNQQTYYPNNQQTYYPNNQQTYYPNNQQTYPQQTYPQQTYPQQTYPQNQGSYGK